MKNQLKQIGLIAFITFVFFSCKKESSIISVTGITISQTSYVVNIGATDTIKASVNPLNATNKDVSWSSSNTSFVSINSSGVVTGVALGTATITATTSDGNKTATCIVNVIASVTGITVLPKIISLNIGNSDTIKAVLTPSNASNKNVSWESSNTAIATVSSLGVVTGIAFGNVLITATTADGNKTATCNVTITKWTTYKRSNGLASDTVWTIATEAQGNVWLGGSDEREAGGISEFNGSSWKKYTRDNSGLIDNTVNTIAIDGQNNKWVGC